jgi:DNA polymerase (family X)
VTNPPDLIRYLLDVSPGHAEALHRDLGILTLGDLELALDDGRIARQIGAEAKPILESAAVALALETPRLPLGRALDLTESLIAAIGPALQTIETAGEVRRYEPVVSSLVVVGRSDDPAGAIEAICAWQRPESIRHRGARRCILFYGNEVEVDVRIAAADEYGAVLFNATGSRAHVAAVNKQRRRAILAPDEAQVYTQAGLRFVPPELRHDTGEVEAAQSGGLPDLVERAHIRGDLHMHTHYSDGRDSVETMVVEAQALGYEYIAITDHSAGASASRTLSVDEIPAQRDAIDRLRSRFPGLAILHGIEVDILANGRLDFKDSVLERFDIVLASLHERSGHDGRRLTERALAALRHPLVSVLTHPQNHIPGRRDGYPLDFDELYRTAAATGTALEIDGGPGHLDMDGEHARAAIAAGVTLTIDSDCHRAPALERQMAMGIGTARRGWVEPHHVLNTRAIAEVEAFIARKRNGRVR